MVFILEAANEKDTLEVTTEVAEFVATETLVAIPRQEAINLLWFPNKIHLNQTR